VSVLRSVLCFGAASASTHIPINSAVVKYGGSAERAEIEWSNSEMK
jgi:hypothetical protein